MNDFLIWLSTNSLVTYILAISFGTIIFITVILYLIAFIQGREISFWPPKIGEKNSKPQVTSQLVSKSAEALGADSEKYQREIEHLRSLLIHIYSLHKVNFSFDYYKIIYIIETDGGVHTTEEMTIRPIENGKVHFRHVSLGTSPNTKGEIVFHDISIHNKSDGKELQFFELNRDTRHLEGAIILNPPATKDLPAEIVMKSYRTGIFAPLVNKLNDFGSVGFSLSAPKYVEIEFIAPPKLEFISIEFSPKFGECTIETRENLSVAKWKATKPKNIIYNYEIRAIRK